MNNPIIQPKPLTQAAFVPYGDVIEVSNHAHHFSINQGYTQRYHNLAGIDTCQFLFVLFLKV